MRDWSDDLATFKKEHPDGVNQKHLVVLEKEMDDFLTRSKQEGILVVLVYPPEYFEAQEMINNREETFAIYRGLAEKHGIEFLDYSEDPICYDTKYFYNSQHMNKAGAELFSAQLADRLAGIVGTQTAAASQALAAPAPGR